jgi:hypothetical protein
MRKKSDVKFIIYQALYIFVVCVVAIKGASLDLTQVINDDGKPKVILTQAEMDSIQNLLKHSIIIDTTLFVVIPKELLKDNERLQTIVNNMPKIDLSNYVLKTEVPPIREQPKIEEKIDEIKKDKEIVIGNVTLYQYHINSVNNQGDNPINVAGVNIPPHSTGKVQIGGETTVVITAGSVNKTVSTLPNQKPKISFQRVATMDGDARVTQLQHSVGYRVTVQDDFPDQLDIKVSGPVTIKEVAPGVIDVTMNAFSSKAAFDNFTDGKTSPYTIGFNVVVKDKIAPHSVTGQQSFYFGEW